MMIQRAGETMVFLHYFGGSAQSWKWVIEKLEGEFRCISINLPGFGGTTSLQVPSIEGYAKYVNDQLNLLAVKNYILIGHSMGGKIAMQLAATVSSGTVEHLILIAPSPPSTESIAPKEKERMLQIPTRSKAEKTIGNITRRMLTDDQYELAIQNQLDIDENTRQWWLFEGVNFSIVDIVKSISMPITVIASEDDPAIPIEEIKKKVIPVFQQSQLITTRNAGHLLPLENAGWVAEKIRIIASKAYSPTI